MSKSWLAERGKLAAVTRHHGPDHPAVTEARRDLRAARAEEYIRKLVDEAPPLTAEQRAALAALLAPAGAA